jgi:hypothetical protein
MTEEKGGTMRLKSQYRFGAFPRPSWGAIKAWEQRLSLLDYARLCRIRSLITAAPWRITDADGLIISYAWPLHEMRHRLQRPDPLEWFVTMVDLERTHDICFISSPVDCGTWDLGHHVVTLDGAIRLLRRFGVGRPWWEEKWTCEDCLCVQCHAPVAYPFTTCLDSRQCVERIQRRRGMRDPGHDAAMTGDWYD